MDALRNGVGSPVRRAANGRSRGLDGDEAVPIEDVDPRVGVFHVPSHRVDPHVVVGGAEGSYGNELHAMSVARRAIYNSVRRVAATGPPRAHQAPLVIVRPEAQAQVEVRARSGPD